MILPQVSSPVKKPYNLLIVFYLILILPFSAWAQTENEDN